MGGLGRFGRVLQGRLSGVLIDEDDARVMGANNQPKKNHSQALRFVV